MFISYGIIPEEKVEKISKILELNPEQQNLYLDNLNGSVTVTGTDNDNITINLEKSIKADDLSALETGINEVNIVFENVDDGYFVYTEIPCTKVDLEKKSLNYCHCEKNGYKFRVDYFVEVPKKFNVSVSTINLGKVEFTNVAGDITAKNVNGPVTLQDVAGKIIAHTINGEVAVNMPDQPLSGSSFSTINGDIQIECTPDLSAKIGYKIMHGDLYTNFTDISQFANKVTKSSDTKRSKTTYEISSRPQIQIGKGKNDLEFKTLNGNIYIRNKAIN